MDPIEPGQMLSEEQLRHVNAALSLRGLDAKSYAKAQSLSYSRLLRMMRGDERLSPSYARKLADLVAIHLVKRVRSDAFAQAA